MQIALQFPIDSYANVHAGASCLFERCDEVDYDGDALVALTDEKVLQQLVENAGDLQHRIADQNGSMVALYRRHLDVLRAELR